jgi:hypothetical protein
MSNDLPSGWSIHLNPSNKAYYFNKATGETTWIRPALHYSNPPPATHRQQPWKQQQRLELEQQQRLALEQRLEQQERSAQQERLEQQERSAQQEKKKRRKPHSCGAMARAF